MDNNGVLPKDKQAGLVAKVKAGTPLEANTATSKPIKKNTSIEDGFTVTREEFSDGSFLETAVELDEPSPAPGGVSTRAIKGCSSRGGTGYRAMSNCLVYANGTTYSVNFRASWVYQQNGTGRISKVWDPSVQVYLGTFSNTSLKITRKTSTSSSPAQARLQWRYTAMGNAAQGDAALYLNVTDRKASTSVN